MKEGYNSRIRKKIYLRDIYWNIMSRHMAFLTYGLKEDRSLTAINELRGVFKSQMKGRGNPFYQSTRLNLYVREGIEIAGRI